MQSTVSELPDSYQTSMVSCYQAKTTRRDALKCLTCYICDMNFSYINAEAYMEHMNKHELDAESGDSAFTNQSAKKKKYLKIATKRIVKKEPPSPTVIIGSPRYVTENSTLICVCFGISTLIC